MFLRCNLDFCHSILQKLIGFKNSIMLCLLLKCGKELVEGSAHRESVFGFRSNQILRILFSLNLSLN